MKLFSSRGTLLNMGDFHVWTKLSEMENRTPQCPVLVLRSVRCPKSLLCLTLFWHLYVFLEGCLS